MKPITFDQKLRILDHLAEERHWGQAPFPMHLYDELRQDRRGVTHFKDEPPPHGVYKRPEAGLSEFFLKGGVDSGVYYNIVDFNPDEWPGFASDQLVNGIKLVIAFDCGIEPNLEYVNLPANAREISQFIRDNTDEDREAWRDGPLGDIKTVLFKSFQDSAAFRGSSIGIPRRFSISRETEAQRVWMGVDQKTSVLAQSHISRIASNASDFASRKDSNFASANIGKIIDLMYEGVQLDLSRNSWLCMRIETAHADQWAEKARHALSQELLMPDGHFGVVVFSPKDLVLSVERDTFYQAVIARRASFDLYEAISTQQDDHNLLVRALSQGADFKYLDPDAAKAGKSFADLMRKYECYGMLAVLRNHQGVHGNIQITDGKMRITPQLGL